jgi:LPS-assembly lipoprotein
MSMGSRSRYPVRAVALGMVLGLGGCFQPMYAPISGRDVVAEARGVAIAPIPGMVGHYLESELRFSLNGSGETTTPRYNLQVTLHESTQSPLVDTVTGRATANSVYTTAEYKLIPVGTTDVVSAGTVVSLASYDRNSQRFANIRAARDAQIRNAHDLAQDIRTRIVADLATRPAK